MATPRTIIKRALRLIQALNVGEEPSAEDASTCLEALQALILELPAMGVGRQLATVEATSDVTLFDGDRLAARPTAAMTVTLPKDPPDGARVAILDPTRVFATYNVTISRNGSLIAGAAANVTLSTNGAERVYRFRADTLDWVEESALTLDGSLPYPSDFDDAFAHILAVRIHPEYASISEGVSPAVLDGADRGRARLRARYGPRVAADPDYIIRRLGDRLTS